MTDPLATVVATRFANTTKATYEKIKVGDTLICQVVRKSIYADDRGTPPTERESTKILTVESEIDVQNRYGKAFQVTDKRRSFRLSLNADGDPKITSGHPRPIRFDITELRIK
jgi:hypothetical protein